MAVHGPSVHCHSREGLSFHGVLAGLGGRSGGQQLELPLINQRDGHCCNKNVPN